MKRQRLLGPVAACALVLGACGTQTAPGAPIPSQAAEVASPSAAPVPCGTVTGPRGPARVSVQGRTVACDEAKTLLTQYFARLTPADLVNPDGAGPLALGPWTCGSDPGAPLAANCSTEDDREIISNPG
ncbi:hypothetical protein [Amycolatopsis taiwanensis]|uniref:hypothetical protein n=1 Tax=Amycolatopsis taiwanensis TaxID=342230 RepID=UPI0004823A88|nr:hypothetical protein [Amycolatopsis taiwanensis]